MIPADYKIKKISIILMDHESGDPEKCSVFLEVDPPIPEDLADEALWNIKQPCFLTAASILEALYSASPKSDRSSVPFAGMRGLK